ncbi:FG-GAP-like repeat-containing protein [Oceanicola sp. D3]|uniref:FG-GAP-like repeat-containing protein n=1 Tax=Oceanicola sp. D3 TaxID=2587163 RepID=UPI00143CF02D|nr:FG-GAP-like repeat-containing protein [Oceanicola sp. D3]
MLCGSAAGQAQEFLSAELRNPTDKYGHGALGAEGEYLSLVLEIGRRVGSEGGIFSGSASLTYELNAEENLVYEDVAPRLWDVTGDGKPEVVVMQSHMELGARLLVIGLNEGKPAFVAATPFIGTRHRWAAPLAAADLDGDGNIEVAFVDRPHLAKILRIWRYSDGDFYEVTSVNGVTNHRFGESEIFGGLRECGDQPELVLADADWKRLVRFRMVDGRMQGQYFGPIEGPESFETALTCR